MHNMVLSPIDPEKLISQISDRVTIKILAAFPNLSEVGQNQSDLLTVNQTAQFLNLSVATIYSKVSRGELSNMKRGKRLYFSKTELLKYLEGGRRKSNSEIEAEASSFLSNQKKGGSSNG